ncbi:mitochondrial carrier domain-containing protein [Xylariaceae sp. FL0255]|nr:mitochondrial carrier domain-containing protein [Xylariaceae sp. FL0255]
MPSALVSDATISEVPKREGSAESIASKMDGVMRKASTVVVGTTEETSMGAPPAADSRSITERRGKPDKRSMDYIMRSFIAGGLAGSAAKTAVAPLDRVKILFQTSNPQFAKYTGSWVGLGRALGDIYTTHGVTGLFRGHLATLLRIYPYAAIKFVAYEQYRATIISRKDQETMVRRFAVGALAGWTSVLFTYPLEVIRVRLAFETKARNSSLTDICKKIYHEHPLPKPTATAPTAIAGVAAVATNTVEAVAPRSGLINFYRGFSTTLLGMLPYAGVSFLTHDTVGDVFRSQRLREHATLPQPANAPKDKPAPLRAWAELTAGGISGAISQTMSYPLEVVRRRMQVGGAVGDGHRLRLGEVIGMIFRERGMQGFFVGLTIGYVKIIPMSAISFYTYERTKTALGI